jgi:hypothetical protein
LNNQSLRHELKQISAEIAVRYLNSAITSGPGMSFSAGTHHSLPKNDFGVHRNGIPQRALQYTGTIAPQRIPEPSYTKGERMQNRMG